MEGVAGEVLGKTVRLAVEGKAHCLAGVKWEVIGQVSPVRTPWRKPSSDEGGAGCAEPANALLLYNGDGSELP